MIPDKLIPNPKLKLLEQMSEVMRFKHYSLRTEQAYRQWVVEKLRVIPPFEFENWAVIALGGHW